MVILCRAYVALFVGTPTCDSEFLSANADLLFICGEQNSLSICTPHLKPLTLSLHHLRTWGRERERHKMYHLVDVFIQSSLQNH